MKKCYTWWSQGLHTEWKWGRNYYHLYIGKGINLWKAPE